MKPLLMAFCCVAGVASASRTQGVPADGIDNVVAFARLYGVVRYFHPADAATAMDWNGFAVLGVSRVRPAADAAALGAALERLFVPLGVGITIGPSLPPAPAIGAPDDALVAWRYLGAAVGPRPGVYRAERTNRPPAATAALSEVRPAGAAVSTADPVSGDHVDVELARGLRARVALALSSEDAARRPDAAALNGLLAAAARVLPTRDADPDTNLADVVVAWNVFRHFYPYWPDLTRDPQVDWDAQLPRHLRAGAAATTKAQQREVLQRLVADAHDGHGRVNDPSADATRGVLPIQARLVEGRVTVTVSAATAVPVGAVVTAVGGQPAARWLEDRVRLKSGTAQWKTELVLRGIECEKGTTVEVAFDDDGGRPRTAPLVCGPRPATPLQERRPAPLAELSHGLWYVDLTRATYQQIMPTLPRLAEARGVVFDMRGYPTDAGAAILAHMMNAPERDRWMHVDRITGPFGRVGSVYDIGWNVQPQAPAIGAHRVFLTDGRAISYAESVMGYVADRKLGTIVGAPTAGTNGNVVSFDVPGGCGIAFTGMRVTRHDGTTRRHLIGIAPDVPLEPTIDGIRRGRDELLEKAVALIDRPPSRVPLAK